MKQTARKIPVSTPSMTSECSRQRARQRVMSLAAAIATLCGSFGQAQAADVTTAGNGGSSSGLPKGADLTIVSRSGGTVSDIKYTTTDSTNTVLDLGTNTKAILNWKHDNNTVNAAGAATGTGFNIDSGSTLHITNSGVTPTILNVVSGSTNGTGTTIAGSISGVANVVILDPNGINITNSASTPGVNHLGLYTQLPSNNIDITSTTSAANLSLSSANDFGLSSVAGQTTTWQNSGKGVLINKNFSLGGDLVIRADSTVTFDDATANRPGSSGQISANNITINANGAVTTGSRTELLLNGSLTLGTANNQNATLRTNTATLGDINLGTGALTITSSGLITQGTSNTITANTVTIDANNVPVGSTTNPLNVNTSTVKIDHGGNSTGSAVFINSVNGKTVSLDTVKADSITLGGAGNFQGTHLLAGTTDATATSTLTIAGFGTVNNLRTATGSIVLTNSNATTLTNAGATSISVTGTTGTTTVTNSGAAPNVVLSNAGTTTLTNTGGVVTINSGATTGSNAAITINNDSDIIVGGTFDGTTSKNSTLSLLTTGSKTVTFNGGAVKLANLNVVADNVVIDPTANSITLDNSGSAKISAETTARNITLGSEVAGTLSLTAGEIAAFGKSAASSANLVIGGAVGSALTSTGTVTVTNNVTSRNALTLKGGTLDFNGGAITVNDGAADKAFTANITGDVTSSTGTATADIVAEAITIDALKAGAVTTVGGGGANADLKVTASGLVNISVGDSVTDFADTIYLRSMGNLSLGSVATRNSGGTLNANDAITLNLLNDVTNGSGGNNLTATLVTIQGTTSANAGTGSSIGVSGTPIKVSGASATGLQVLNYATGSASTAGASFKSVNISSDNDWTLQNNIYTDSSTGTGISLAVTKTGGTLDSNGKTLSAQYANANSKVILSAPELTLSTANSISTGAGGTVELSDTAGNIALGAAGVGAGNDLSQNELKAVAVGSHLTIKSAGNITIDAAYDTNLGAYNATTRNVTLDATGNIVNAGTTATSVVKGGVLTLKGANVGTGANPVFVDASAGSLLVNAPTGSAYIKTGANLPLGNSTVDALTITSTAGTVTEAASATVTVTNAANITTANGLITLGGGGTTANFGSLNLTSGSGAITIVEGSAMDITGISTTGALSMTANGAITQSSGTITATGTTAAFSTGNTNADINLDKLNTLTDTVAATVTGAGNITITNATNQNVTLGNISMGTGTLTVSGQSISQGAGTTITESANAGVASFTAATAGQNITLDQLNSITGRVDTTVTGAGTVTITNAATQDLVLGNISMGTGTLTASGKSISQANATTITEAAGAGVASFTAAAGQDITLNKLNSITGRVVANASGAGNVTITNATNQDVTLGNISLGTGTLTVSGQSISQFAGSTITESAGAGAASFTAGAGQNITLDQLNTITGSIVTTASGAGNVTITNATTQDLVLGNISLGTGTLTASGKSISQANATTITESAGAGIASFTAAAGQNILLDKLNTLTGSVAATATTTGNVTITNATTQDLVLGNVSLGTGTLTASGKSISQANATTITESAGAGLATFTAAAGQNITLNKLNSIAGSVVATATGAGNVTVTNAATQDLVLGNISLGTGTLAATGKSISQTAGTSIAGASGGASFTANANDQTIALNNAANAITGAVTFTTQTAGGNTGDASINNGVTALNVGASTVRGALTLSSTGGNISDSGTLTVNSLSFQSGGTVTLSHLKTATINNSYAVGNVALTNDGTSALTVGNILVKDATGSQYTVSVTNTGNDITLGGAIAAALTANTLYSTVSSADFTTANLSYLKNITLSTGISAGKITSANNASAG
ncbi:MAG: S-layer family protein, partial [Magnetococcales bacterium]|nr:S-layer family protein [Magnetococcales bacterium]